MKMMDTSFFRLVRLCVVALAVIFATPASSQGDASALVRQPSASASQVSVKPATSESHASLLARYPTGSITSVAQANRALEDVKKGRKEIELRFKAEEKACYKIFLANKCVAEAKERRRVALAEVKPIQIQADHFKRHDAVVKREKALADRNAKEEAKTRPALGVDERGDKFKLKQEQAAEKEQTLGGKRAENEVAFQKKTKDREAAQLKVEEKRAKTERRRKKKAASAAAAAANRTPPSSVPAASAGN
jgi:colicin import membrane protein